MDSSGQWRLPLGRRQRPCRAPYTSAFHIIDQVLSSDPEDVDALLLKGNLLDLEATDSWVEMSPEGKLRNLEAARRCYVRVLEVDEENVNALRDLGDYWGDRQQIDRAIHYYDRASAILQAREPSADRDESLAEIHELRAELMDEESSS